MSFFEGLVVTEDGLPVEVAYVGDTPTYVIDDHGFRRHVDAASVDRVVLAQFLAQLQEHRDEASQAMLRWLGQDDLFTKAAVDSTIRGLDVEQVMHQRLPTEARQWLGMMGFKVVIDLHGEVVRIDMPSAPEESDEE